MSCFLLKNSVHTYPRTVVGMYDLVTAVACLRSWGVTELGLSTRSQTVPGSHWSDKPQKIVHSEIWFAMPDDATLRASSQYTSPGNPQNQIRASIDLALGRTKEMPRLDMVAWHVNAGDVYSAAEALSGYLTVEVEENGIIIGSRENGDVGDESPGQEDIKAVREFCKGMRDRFPGIAIENASVDEFTEVLIPFSAMDKLGVASLNDPSSQRKPKP